MALPDFVTERELKPLRRRQAFRKAFGLNTVQSTPRVYSTYLPASNIA
jgi:hypothetical protein